jgi:hypothetical protein
MGIASYDFFLWPKIFLFCLLGVSSSVERNKEEELGRENRKWGMILGMDKQE